MHLPVRSQHIFALQRPFLTTKIRHFPASFAHQEDSGRDVPEIGAGSYYYNCSNIFNPISPLLLSQTAKLAL